MLYRETTSDELFNVLVKLMAIPELSDFRLVGGTALSLLRGHRLSVDIDMFCYKKKDWETIKNEIIAEARKL